MIVKMKEVTLVVNGRNRDDALSALRKLGVLHVRSTMQESTEDISTIGSLQGTVDKALAVLDPYTAGKVKKAKDMQPVVQDIITYQSELATMRTRLSELEQTCQWYNWFGRVSGESIDVLKNQGVHIRFYQTDKAGLKTVSPDRQVYVAGEQGGTVYCALISDSPDDVLDFKEMPMPDTEYGQLKKDITLAQKDIAALEKKLHGMAAYKEALAAYRKQLDKRLEYARVRAGMGNDEDFAYVSGYCPADATDSLKQCADKESWAYIIADPDNLRDVPTLLRNPRWLRIVQPLFDFMGTLPGYHELDVSFAFLAFFSLFYAILIGDAGYGLVFLAGTLFLSRKFKDAPQEPFYLMYLLSAATILWGLLSGTWFGSEQLAQLPVLRDCVLPQLDSFSDSSQNFVMQLTFTIGAIHLSIARLMSAFKRMNSPTAIAELGWIAIIWGIYFVANNLILSVPLNSAVIPLVAGGAAVVALFANFQKNIVKGFLLSLGNLPLDIISSFSDVVSYIRLFAVGFATVIVASSFNDMAAGVGFNSILSGVMVSVILVFGHGLNIILGLMAVLVHGVRLNMLEFSGHCNLEWSGRNYMPFKE